jgi:hypothetical protein
MTEISKPFWHRYSLKTLFIAITIVILVIAAYAIGYQHGRLTQVIDFYHQDINSQNNSNPTH